MNYEILSVTLIIMAALAVLAVPSMLGKIRHEFCVPEGWAGLLYHHGLYVRRNNAGRHIIWGRGWTIDLIDLRTGSLMIPAEDVITADNVSLRISPHIRYQITDPAKAAHESQHWSNELCFTARRALHFVLSGLSYQELRNERFKIGAQLLAYAQPEAAKTGVSIRAIDLKYWNFPAEASHASAIVNNLR